jgi:hypothetical protein
MAQFRRVAHVGKKRQQLFLFLSGTSWSDAVQREETNKRDKSIFQG